MGRRRSLYVRRRNGVEDDKVEDFFQKSVETPFAALSQRIKEEQNRFSNITGPELGALCRFVASQTVRTLAHKQCIEQQAGGPVDTNTFVRVMLRKMWTLLNSWIQNPPNFHFYTSLRHVGDRFITGDSPVLVIQVKDNPIWVPTDTPSLEITDLSQILKNPSRRFWIPLSPYVGVSMLGHGGGEPHLPPQMMDPQFVRFLNDRIRGQSGLFILARDKSSLA